MTDPDESNDRQDPLVAGVKRAALHLGKAGAEVLAAVGEVSKGVVAKVRPASDDDSDSGGPQRVPVD